MLVSIFKTSQKRYAISNPFIDYINQLQNISTLTSQSKRSNENASMMNTISKNIPKRSRPLFSPLKFVDTHSVRNTNNKTFHSNTYLNATANPFQTLYQPHSTPMVQAISYPMGLSASLPAKSSVPTVNQ